MTKKEKELQMQTLSNAYLALDRVQVVGRANIHHVLTAMVLIEQLINDCKIDDCVDNQT